MYGLNINMNDPLINLNQVLDTCVNEFYIPPIYTLLNNRNLLIYYQLLLNQK